MPPKRSHWWKACTIFTGAGFSVPFGLPPTAGLWNIGLTDSNSATQAGLLLDSGRQSYPLLHFIEKSIEDVELLLTTWEAYLETLLSVYPGESGLPTTYRDHYIANLAFHLEERSAGALDKDPGRELVRWFRAVSEDIPFSVITTNYDRIMEMILAAAGLGFTYNSDYPIAAPVRKLHGSVNWIKGAEDMYRQADKWKPRSIHNLHDYSILDFELQPLPLIAGEVVPVIVPPTIRKEYEQYFRIVMGQSFDYMRKARRLLIVGYSFPPADLVLQKLVKDATSSAEDTQEILYVNPDGGAIQRAQTILPRERTTFREEAWSLAHFEWLTDLPKGEK